MRVPRRRVVVTVAAALRACSVCRRSHRLPRCCCLLLSDTACTVGLPRTSGVIIDLLLREKVGKAEKTMLLTCRFDQPCARPCGRSSTHLFPNRHGRFEGINAIFYRSESLPAVRRGHGNNDAALFHWHDAEGRDEVRITEIDVSDCCRQTQ